MDGINLCYITLNNESGIHFCEDVIYSHCSLAMKYIYQKLF
uniref:Uncharacterized protein n=1 Tax=Anguilla anguilla TaxID=7936 RepID=A0A0E9PY56_ANGAN